MINENLFLYLKLNFEVCAVVLCLLSTRKMSYTVPIFAQHILERLELVLDTTKNYCSFQGLHSDNSLNSNEKLIWN